MMFGLITRAKHERILAEGQARAQEVIAKANADRRTVGRALAEKVDECRVLTRERDEARASLAKFTGPRARDAKGHFVKGGGK